MPSVAWVANDDADGRALRHNPNIASMPKLMHPVGLLTPELHLEHKLPPYRKRRRLEVRKKL